MFCLVPRHDLARRTKPGTEVSIVILMVILLTEVFENSKQHFYSCTDYMFIVYVLKSLRFEGCDDRHSSTLSES